MGLLSALILMENQGGKKEGMGTGGIAQREIRARGDTKVKLRHQKKKDT